MNDLILLLDTGQELVLELGADAGYAPPYTGEYDITPRLTEQVLATKLKRMADNVTVREIPVTYTLNPQNGRTVVIG